MMMMYRFTVVNCVLKEICWIANYTRTGDRILDFAHVCKLSISLLTSFVHNNDDLNQTPNTPSGLLIFSSVLM